MKTVNQVYAAINNEQEVAEFSLFNKLLEQRKKRVTIEVEAEATRREEAKEIYPRAVVILRELIMAEDANIEAVGLKSHVIDEGSVFAYRIDDVGYVCVEQYDVEPGAVVGFTDYEKNNTITGTMTASPFMVTDAEMTSRIADMFSSLMVAAVKHEEKRFREEEESRLLK